MAVVLVYNQKSHYGFSIKTHLEDTLTHQHRQFDKKKLKD